MNTNQFFGDAKILANVRVYHIIQFQVSDPQKYNPENK